MVVISAPLTTSSGVNDVFIAEGNRYALVATTAGVEYVDLLRGQVVSSGTIPGGYEPLCLAADWTTSSGLLYVGTSGGGVFATRYHPAREPGLDFSGSLQPLFSTGSLPPISGDVVVDLGVAPGALFVTTESGVDYIRALTDRSTRPLAAGSSRVRLVANGGVAYWLTSTGVEVNYDLISTLTGGIIGVDFSYSTSTVPALPGPQPSDIALAEGSPRVLAIPTVSGILIFTEVPGAESSAQTKILYAPDAYEEDPAPLFVSADFSSGATFNSGVIFATTPVRGYAFRMAALSTLRIHAPDLSENPLDFSLGQQVISGTQTILRTTTVPVKE